MRDVHFHPAAVGELEYARSWYEAQSPGLGRQFLEQIEQAIGAVRESPTTWPLYSSETRRFLVHRFPFAIVYRYDKEVVRVIAVMHLKRKPGYWKHREIQ